MPHPKNTPEIFWSKVNISPDKNACWLWTAGSFSDGYGRISWNNQIERAHRIAYILTFGVNLGDLWVLHKCDTPLCCNPKHLFLGTNQDNVDDKVAKGRQAILRGESHGTAKLTAKQVDEIRHRYAAGGITKVELSRQFNVSEAQVRNIIAKRRWR